MVCPFCVCVTNALAFRNALTARFKTSSVGFLHHLEGVRQDQMDHFLTVLQFMGKYSIMYKFQLSLMRFGV